MRRRVTLPFPSAISAVAGGALVYAFGLEPWVSYLLAAVSTVLAVMVAVAMVRAARERTLQAPTAAPSRLALEPSRAPQVRAWVSDLHVWPSDAHAQLDATQPSAVEACPCSVCLESGRS